MPTICSTCGLTIPKSGCATGSLRAKCPNLKPSTLDEPAASLAPSNMPAIDAATYAAPPPADDSFRSGGGGDFGGAGASASYESSSSCSDSSSSSGSDSGSCSSSD